MLKYSFDKKLEYLSNIRTCIKNKKIHFDPTKEKFGMTDLVQLKNVDNTTELKGYPYEAVMSKYSKYTKGINIGLKIIPVSTMYGKSEHPCNIENILLKSLTDELIKKRVSPHITYYFGTMQIGNKCKATKMLDLKKLENEGRIKQKSVVLLSEFVNGGSITKWVSDTYANDLTISDYQWKILTFQIVYTLAVLHEMKCVHNDTHYGNVLIDTTIKPGGYFVYNFHSKKYYVKNTGIIPKLFDFEFSMVYSNKIPGYYPNKNIIGDMKYDNVNHRTIIENEDDLDSEDKNVPYEFNDVYDLHFFLTSLLEIFIPKSLYDFIINVYPYEVLPEDSEINSSICRSTNSSDYGSDSCSSIDSDTSSESSCSSSESSCSSSDTSSSYVDVDIMNNEQCNSIKSLTESESSSYSDTCSSIDSDSSSDKDPYILKGRLINGVEKMFDLPTPFTILDHPFFEELTKIPEDFDPMTAIEFTKN